MTENTQYKNRKKRTIQNKAMNIVAKLKSETFFAYTQSSGDIIISAFSRVGIISLFTANDPKLQKIWDAWYKETNAEFLKEVSSVQKQTSVLRKRLPKDFVIPTVEFPDNYVWKFSVTTPQTYQLTNLILKMDELMHDIESLWLLGQVEAEELATARNQAIGSVKRLISTIFGVTKAGKRLGGPYTTSNFMKAFREQKGLPINKSDKKTMNVDVKVEPVKAESVKENNEIDVKAESVKEKNEIDVKAESVKEKNETANLEEVV